MAFETAEQPVLGRQAFIADSRPVWATPQQILASAQQERLVETQDPELLRLMVEDLMRQHTEDRAFFGEQLISLIDRNRQLESELTDAYVTVSRLESTIVRRIATWVRNLWNRLWET